MTIWKLWGSKWLVNALAQLPLLWFVLTISPELNPARSVWVLVIVYGFLIGAVTGFESVFQERKVIRSTTVWWKRSSGVWWTAAAIYLAAAALSAGFVGMFFTVLVSLYAVLALGSYTWLIDEQFFQKLAKAFLNGIFALVILYAGISNLPFQNVFKLSVIIPGAVASFLFLGFSFVREERVGAYVASCVVFASAGSLFVPYTNHYLSPKYAFDIAVFFVLTAIVLILLHPSILKGTIVPVLSTPLFQWAIVLILNAYFFYVFADYTQILQLI